MKPLYLVALLTLSAAAYAAESATLDITPQLIAAGANVEGLRALEVGGIVVLKGATSDPAQAEAATAAARSLGYTRVANMIRIVDAPDDAKIERTAERALATRVLDGCTFHVDSQQGVVTVDGKVRYELQKDVAVNILRNISGVRAVRASIQR